MGIHGRLWSKQGKSTLPATSFRESLAAAKRPGWREGGWGGGVQKSTWAVRGPGQAGEGGTISRRRGMEMAKMGEQLASGRKRGRTEGWRTSQHFRAGRTSWRTLKGALTLRGAPPRNGRSQNFNEGKLTTCCLTHPCGGTVPTDGERAPSAPVRTRPH